jgi:uncharacterized iron-regulated protein
MAFGKKEKTFATITAPLSGMVEELTEYAEEQERKVEDFNIQKQEIDRQIDVAEDEKAKSVVTSKNLKAFMDPTRVLVTEEAIMEEDKAEEAD